MAGASAILFLPDDTARTGLSKPLLLTELLGSTLLGWLCGALYRGGTRRVLLVCRDAWAAAAVESCPAAIAAEAVSQAGSPDSLRAFLASAEAWEQVLTVLTGPVVFDRWTAFCPAAEPDPAAPRTPCGVWDVPIETLRAALEGEDAGFDFPAFLQSAGVAYTDLDGLYAAASAGELNQWRDTLRRARVRDLEDAGVNVWDPDTVWAGPEVTVSPGTTLLPGVILRGCTNLGPDCTIGPNALLWNANLDRGAVVNASQVYDSSVGAYASVGPYAVLRPGTVLGEGARVGPFSETKNATLEQGAHMEGLGYVGQTTVGAGASLGRGVVTVDHDGQRSWQSQLGPEAWVGPGVTLSSPVEIGQGAYVAPGSVITDNVPDGALGVSGTRQSIQKDWVRRQQKKNK